MTASTGVVDYVRNQTRPALSAVGGFVRMCVLTGKALPVHPWAYLRLAQGFVTANRHDEILRRGGRIAIEAAPYLPPGPRVDQFLSAAPLVATFHQRQSVLALLRLAVRGLIAPSARPMLWMAAAALWMDAREA